MVRIRTASVAGIMIGIIAIVLIPVACIVLLAINIQGMGLSTVSDATRDLINTATFSRYAGNTVVLVVLVAVISAVLGVVSAWLVTVYSFPLRGVLEYSLFFPLAMPAYVAAYALVDFLEYAGPVQSIIRHVFNFTLASEYYFPEIRSLGGASITLSLVLFPYVYLFSRTALREQSSAFDEVASTLGKGPFSRFVGVFLPLIRPGVFAGLIVVIMETVADYGVVDYFAVQTVTAGIFSVWLDGNDLQGSARLALGLVVIVFIIVMGEKRFNARAGFYTHPRKSMRIMRRPLTGLHKYGATLYCLILVMSGFVLPVGIILNHALANHDWWFEKGLLQAFVNSFYTGGTAAVVTVAMAMILVYGQSILKNRILRFVLPLTTLGYAIPGAVLGLGILIFMITVDHHVADMIKAVWNVDTGLIFTGTAFGIILAYCIRFYAISHNMVEAALGRIAPSIQMVPRSLGKSASESLIKVHVPIIKGSLLTGLLLVFVDSIKELPATLLLRPFDFNTLATRVYDRASLENLGQASPAALLVVLTGCLGVLLLVNMDRKAGHVIPTASHDRRRGF